MDVSSFKGELSPEMQDVIMVLYPAFRALPFLALLAIGLQKNPCFSFKSSKSLLLGIRPCLICALYSYWFHDSSVLGQR